MASHLRLDFNGVEDLQSERSTVRNLGSLNVSSSYRKNGAYLAVVDADNTTDHLRYDDHVTEVRFDDSRLLIGWSLLLRFPQFFDEPHGTALEAALKPPSCTSMNKANELINPYTERNGEAQDEELNTE